MAELMESGRVVDLILVVLAAEGPGDLVVRWKA